MMVPNTPLVGSLVLQGVHQFLLFIQESERLQFLHGIIVQCSIQQVFSLFHLMGDHEFSYYTSFDSHYTDQTSSSSQFLFSKICVKIAQ